MKLKGKVYRNVLLFLFCVLRALLTDWFFYVVLVLVIALCSFVVYVDVIVTN